MRALNVMITVAMRRPIVRRLLNWIQIRRLAATILRIFPTYRQVPGTDLTYRMTLLDNILIAREIFENGEYAALKRYNDIRSFVDLGSNCGFFTLYTVAIAGDRSICGLAIDAHPAMVRATSWHIERNSLDNIHAVWGLAGALPSSAGKFFVNIDAAGSSQFAEAPAANVTVDPWTEISVPVLSVAAEWSSRFGSMSCDVLKVDIEGSEEVLLLQEGAFVRDAGLLLIEIHKWIVAVESISRIVATYGFDLCDVLRDDEHVQVALFVNRTGRFAEQPVVATVVP